MLPQKQKKCYKPDTKKTRKETQVLQNYLKLRQPYQPLRQKLKAEALGPKELSRLTGISPVTLDWNFWGLYNTIPSHVLDFLEDEDLPYLQEQYRLHTRVLTGQLDLNELASANRLQLAKAFCIQPAQILRFEKGERALPTDLATALAQAFPEENLIKLAQRLFLKSTVTKEAYGLLRA